ncbi:MAG: hypothetical protein COV91_06235 [Candidatus Taylorbacteria bacterium CG11_big_fil_rev_8_21_14_0_20_46_11]|uniref:Uncharacterized protein n=1 Tax=Candidatus Taylorbacteria bacterium CG11_big_fil_rev_8_21_14_0_20_46_11 TaxID=1975025 RepID=A0A2H0K9X9_9BACT|nr:MAG: hypothetical protein COV91_06235 [Candidatus Taylorbacteria bacterium CG11_big_fil_rev_8_21_14_0_20_46_11]
MTTKLIIWIKDSTWHARLIREEVYNTETSTVPGAEVIYIGLTETCEQDEEILRRMAILELKRPFTRKITWPDTREVWKF